jgi:hypothetical protein
MSFWFTARQDLVFWKRLQLGTSGEGIALERQPRTWSEFFRDTWNQTYGFDLEQRR